MKNYSKLLLLCFILFSCGKNNEQNNNENTNSFKPDFSYIKSVSKEINFDSTVDLILDNDITINKKKFTKISKEFFNSYLKDNNLFKQTWADSVNQYCCYAEHYFWGYNQPNKNMNYVLIYEYFILDASENKLFLLAIDNSGNLQFVHQVSEISEYRGATYKIYSQLNTDTLKTTCLLQGVGINYDKEANEYEYEIDSVINVYAINNNKSISQVFKDSLSYTVYK